MQGIVHITSQMINYQKHHECPTEWVGAEVGCQGQADASPFIRTAPELYSRPQVLPPALNSPTGENSVFGTGWPTDTERNTKPCCVKSLKSRVR